MVTAKYNSSIGAICTNEIQRKEATEIMEEIRWIANQKEIPLPNNIVDITFEKASSFPPTTPTSLQLDINSGKENSELELFAGAILKYGADFNKKCHFTQKIYTELKGKQTLNY